MLACNCSQNLQISQHIEYLLLFTQDPLKCQSCILFEHLSPSLSLSDLLNAPSKIVIFISFVQRNRLSPALFGDWLECQRSAFHGQRCWSLRNVLIFFFLLNLMSCQNINLWPQQLINVQTKTFECVSSQIPTGVECCGEGAGYKSTEISRVLDSSDKMLISTVDVCLGVFLVSVVMWVVGADAGAWTF